MRSPGLARPAGAVDAMSRVPSLSIEMVRICGTRTVSLSLVGDGLALRRGRVSVGGVVDLAGVDVGLADGVGGGAGLGLTRIERGGAGGQVTVTDGSVTVTPVRVTLPVLVTTKV